MTSFRSKSITVTVATIALAAIALFVGCSQAPTASNTETTQPQLLQRSTASLNGAVMSSADLSVAETISAEEGGTLVLCDVVLEIPPHAVDNDTLFSIAIPDPAVFYNDFGTDGLVFNVPVRVTMSYRDADLSGVDESTIRIGWYDESTGQFEDMVCEVDYVNKTVTGELHHFSAYGLISD